MKWYSYHPNFSETIILSQYQYYPVFAIIPYLHINNEYCLWTWWSTAEHWTTAIMANCLSAIETIIAVVDYKWFRWHPWITEYGMYPKEF